MEISRNKIDGGHFPVTHFTSDTVFSPIFTYILQFAMGYKEYLSPRRSP